MSSDCREEWYDEKSKTAITIVDVSGAAQRLADGHLCGPTSARFLAEGLAEVALIAGELERSEETVSLQMKCKGPLKGINVEISGDGKLRGYTEKKLLDEFDGMGRADARKVVGEKQLQVTRSVPGKILSQAIATNINGYLNQSLQRNASIKVWADAGDDGKVSGARGVMVEKLPDAEEKEIKWPVKLNLQAASRTILKALGYAHAELKRTTPLKFGCRCSMERAKAMLGALSDEERKTLPGTVDVTCHMCGRTYMVPTKEGKV